MLQGVHMIKLNASVPVQAKTYDPEGEYVAYWLPELGQLPKERRNFPGQSYIKQIVPLKFGNTHQSTHASNGRSENTHHSHVRKGRRQNKM